MCRKLVVIFGLSMLLAVAGSAFAGVGQLSWQTTPILGTDRTLVNDTGALTGHVTMITGPTPIDPNTGLPYLDEGGNTVLGPTIPHYSIPGDSLYHVGSPGMTVFDWTGKVANGSGINLNAGHTYDWTAVYTNLGTGYQDYSAGVYTDPGTDEEGGVGFIMLSGYLWGDDTHTSTLGLGDVGQWNYTETWTDRHESIKEVIIYSTDFSVVPEPATLVIWSLLSASGLGLARWRRRK